MIRHALLASVLTSTLLLHGCDKPGEATGQQSARILVVDLDAVARSLGRMDQINAQITQANRTLLAQRAQIQSDLQKQVNEKQKTMGDKPTDEQKKELTMLVAAANQRMRAIDNEVNIKSRRVRAALITQFREQAKPVAGRLAAERGAGLVMTTTDQMLWADPEADITDEVAEAMRADGPVAPLIPSTTTVPRPKVAPLVPPAPTTAPAPAPEKGDEKSDEKPRTLDR